MHLRTSPCVLGPEGTFGKAGVEAGAGVWDAGGQAAEAGTELLYSGHSFKASCGENKQSLCSLQLAVARQGCPSLRVYLKSPLGGHAGRKNAHTP